MALLNIWITFWIIWDALIQRSAWFYTKIIEPYDIITEDSKFGYSEYIKLSKKIIEFGLL